MTDENFNKGWVSYKGRTYKISHYGNVNVVTNREEKIGGFRTGFVRKILRQIPVNGKTAREVRAASLTR
jgi:hypothetical protein